MLGFICAFEHLARFSIYDLSVQIEKFLQDFLDFDGIELVMHSEKTCRL